jgi:hypothetical protein
MSATVFFKTPDERLDFDVDFARWLPAGDSIASAAATITGGTATIDATEVVGTAVKVWIEDGDDGDTSHVQVLATTAEGRVAEMCFRLRVKDC